MTMPSAQLPGIPLSNKEADDLYICALTRRESYTMILVSMYDYHGST